MIPLSQLPQELAEQFKTHAKRKRQIGERLRSSVIESDLTEFRRCLADAGNFGLLDYALRCTSRMAMPSSEFKRGFLEIWFESGDDFRSEASSDAVIVAALRVLAPQYEGPGMTLYRGQNKPGSRSKRPGISWTSDREVARSFALGISRTFDGGSVILQADIPAEGIVSTLHSTADYDEAEYIVNPKFIKKYRVIEAFEQRDHRS